MMANRQFHQAGIDYSEFAQATSVLDLCLRLPCWNERHLVKAGTRTFQRQLGTRPTKCSITWTNFDDVRTAAPRSALSKESSRVRLDYKYVVLPAQCSSISRSSTSSSNQSHTYRASAIQGSDTTGIRGHRLLVVCSLDL